MDATLQDPLEASVEETAALVRAVKIEVARRVKIAADARRLAEGALNAASSVEEIVALGKLVEACREIVPAELLSALTRLEVQQANLAGYVRMRKMTRLPASLSDDTDDLDA
jgi:hypothetical protein